MKTLLCLIPALALLGAAPAFAAKGDRKAAKAAGPAGTPAPSVQLRGLIDTTLPKISKISNEKQPPINRTKLVEAQADYTVKAQTAPAAQQPMYQAALRVVASLSGAVDEHEKAVADYHYSKSVHGKQDREDSKVSNPTRGVDAGALGRADNAKQKMENAASRQALLDKEKFMNNGTAAAWAQRVGQIHDIIEQSYTAELVAEKQLAMVKPATPPPAAVAPPVPKATPKPAETSAATAYSPTGSWKAEKGNWALNEDGNFMAPHGRGTWEWSDRSKRELSFHWRNKTVSKGTFSADGKTIQVTMQNGQPDTLSR